MEAASRSQPGRGMTRVDQVQQNAQAADWVLTPAEVQEIDRMLPKL